MAVTGVARAETPPADTPSPTVDGTAMLLLSGHADPRDGHIYSIVPAFASVSMVADQLSLGNLGSLRVVMTGWAEAILGDDDPGRPSTADLDVGYVEGRFFKDRLEVRVGRQLVTGGAARVTQMDGATATWHFPLGLAATAYGGVPVTPRFGISRGDAMYGGRLYWRRGTDTEIGVSAINVLDKGVAARTDGALDVRIGILRDLSVTEYTLFSLTEARLAQADAALVFQPNHDVQARVDFLRTAPDLFLPRTSVLSVFSQETRNQVGGDVYWRPIALLRLDGEYHAIVDDVLGHRADLKLTFAPGRITDGALGIDLSMLHLDTSGYWRARVFAMRRMGLLSFTVDLDGFYLEKAINDQDFSFTAQATAGWDFAVGWRAVLVGMTDVTPLVEHREEVMLKLVYNHLWRVHTGGKQ